MCAFAVRVCHQPVVASSFKIHDVMLPIRMGLVFDFTLAHNGLSCEGCLTSTIVNHIHGSMMKLCIGHYAVIPLQILLPFRPARF